jgi:signal transduction histidine kinase
MPLIVLFAAIFVLGVGAAALWANPYRFTNHVFALGSVLFAAWFLLVRESILHGREHIAAALPWLRAEAAVAGFGPWCLALLCESIIAPQLPRRELLFRCSIWLIAGIALIPLCYTNGFAFANSLQDYGRTTVYFVYTLILLFAYLFLILKTWQVGRVATGVKRVEIRFLAANFCTGIFISTFLNFAGNSIPSALVRRTSLFILVVTWGLNAWGISFFRVFEVRQIFDVIWKRMVCMFCFAAILAAACIRLANYYSTPVAIGIAVILCLPILVAADKYSRNWLGGNGSKKLTSMRTTVLTLAQIEPDISALCSKLETFLSIECSSERVIIYSGEMDSVRLEEHNAIRRSIEACALARDGWVSLESLQRRRRSPELNSLIDFLIRRRFGLIISSPSGTSQPSLLVAFGSKLSDHPYTFPEIERLQNVAELMDNILIRSRLTTQAVLKAKMEHLAMMSRGLAHDLKNLITPISTFLLHTEGVFKSASIEEEVRTAAVQSIKVMRDYAEEAGFFARRLELKMEVFNIEEAFFSVVSLNRMRAQQGGINLVIAADSNHPILADKILLHRLVDNLVHNAIDASSDGGRIILSALRLDNDILRVEVKDRGSGILPQHLTHIFDPYFTTKKFGGEARGFGFGLTICQKIAHLHGGTIRVRNGSDVGTIFIVDLPHGIPTQVTESTVAGCIEVDRKTFREGFAP